MTRPLLLTCSLATVLACTVETSRAPSSRALEVLDDHAIARYQVGDEVLEIEVELERTPTPEEREQILDGVEQELPLSLDEPDDVPEWGCFCFWRIDQVECCCEIDETWWC
jgi:hypothetical protein